MQLYLPIAEVSVNAFLLLGIGGIVGFLSGMFGVGGGFLITPLLFFFGIPPAVAVATGANQVVASSVSGVLAQMRRKAHLTDHGQHRSNDRTTRRRFCAPP